jgi:16S rRNA pseudouridine516 synthase
MHGAMPRLDALLAHNLGWSRSDVGRALRRGRVAAADGALLRDGALPIDVDALPMDVVVDDARVTLVTRMDVLLHKPVGFVTALRDREHRTAFELVAEAPMHGDLRAVGRLDVDSTGLLLWTTDGTLLHRLTHPRHRVPRTYHVALAGPWDEGAAPVLSDGHAPDIVELAPADRAQMHPALLVPDTTRCFARITITSGRFHEVRRLFVELGSRVLGLCRTAYGGVALPDDLEAGAWRPLTVDERERLEDRSAR